MRARLRAETKKTVVLEIQASQDCQLELWGIQDRGKAVEKTLGRKMKVEVNGSQLTTLPAAPQAGD